MFGVNLNSKIMSCKLLCEKCNQEIDLEKVFIDYAKYVKNIEPDQIPFVNYGRTDN